MLEHTGWFIIDCTIEKRIILYVKEKINYRKIIGKYILTSPEEY